MCQGSSNKNNKKGYTLLEVLLSVVFLSIISASLILPFSESISLSSNDQNIINANNLARLYIKDTELNWQIQANYDIGNTLEVSEVYTNNDQYNVTTSVEDIATNSTGIVILKRLSVNYKSKSGTPLADIFVDINRPGINNL